MCGGVCPNSSSRWSFALGRTLTDAELEAEGVDGGGDFAREGKIRFLTGEVSPGVAWRACKAAGEVPNSRGA